jgi:hypothetical protein
MTWLKNSSASLACTFFILSSTYLPPLSLHGFNDKPRISKHKHLGMVVDNGDVSLYIHWFLSSIVPSDLLPPRTNTYACSELMVLSTLLPDASLQLKSVNFRNA